MGYGRYDMACRHFTRVVLYTLENHSIHLRTIHSCRAIHTPAEREVVLQNIPKLTEKKTINVVSFTVNNAVFDLEWVQQDKRLRGSVSGAFSFLVNVSKVTVNNAVFDLEWVQPDKRLRGSVSGAFSF